MVGTAPTREGISEAGFAHATCELRAEKTEQLYKQAAISGTSHLLDVSVTSCVDLFCFPASKDPIH